MPADPAASVAGPVLGEWAGFVVRLRERGLAAAPDDVIASMEECLTDTVAVMVSGARHEATEAVARYVRALGVAGPGIPVRGPRTAPHLTALINGTAAQSEDFDDAANAVIGGHPSAVLVPAALALGDLLDVPGDTLIAALVAGYEVMFAAGAAVNPRLYEAGLHPTPILGTLGAAAIAAALYGLDAPATAHAMAIAASFSSGIKGNFGSMTKPMHSGWAAQAGITAAQLAMGGLTANPAVLEARHGFVTVYGGPDAAGRLAGRLGDHWFLRDPGVGLRKLYPCCASIHASVAGTLALRERHGLRPDDVAGITLHLPDRRIPHTNRPAIGNITEARFSQQYCVAAALVHGRLAPSDFTGSALDRPDITGLMRRVRPVPDAELSKRDPGMRSGGDFCARVVAELRDGRVLEHFVDSPPGSRNHPVGAAGLKAKFLGCTEPVIGTENAARLLEALQGFRHLASVRGLLQPVNSTELPVVPQ